MQLAEAAQDVAASSMHALHHLASRDGSRANLAISPLSLHAALPLLATGTRGGTLDEMASFLGPAGGSTHSALASYVALCVFVDGAAKVGVGPLCVFANGVWVGANLLLKAWFARVAAQR
jgi:serpin B